MNALSRVVTRIAATTLKWLAPVTGSWWWPQVLESYQGAWQNNVVVDRSIVAAYWAVFSCVTLIAKDISKLLPTIRKKAGRIFVLDEGDPLNVLLEHPNHYQNRVEFLFTWMVSELLCGNTYVLKRRDAKGIVDALYILDPHRVVVLVSEDGGVYYQLSADNLAEIEDKTITVPQSEIIHDKMYPLFHPLVGLSPIFACGVQAMQGNAILQNSTKFFENQSRPGGTLTAPGSIGADTAQRLKETWEANYSGANAGRVAILGDGLKYEPMTMVSAHDAQLIEQLKMTAEMIAACYHVPGYKIGVGQAPSINNTALLNQQYYDQCLQYLIEKLELRLQDGLEVKKPKQVWLDLSGLLRMDPSARYDSHGKAIGGGWLAPNEARMEEDLPPVDGGDSPMMQQQNYSLAALAKRDAAGPPPPSTPVSGPQADALKSVINGVMEGKLSIGAARMLVKFLVPTATEADLGIIAEGVKLIEHEREDDEPEEEFDESEVLAFTRAQFAETTHA